MAYARRHARQKPHDDFHLPNGEPPGSVSKRSEAMVPAANSPLPRSTRDASTPVQPMTTSVCALFSAKNAAIISLKSLFYAKNAVIISLQSLFSVKMRRIFLRNVMWPDLTGKATGVSEPAIGPERDRFNEAGAARLREF